MWRERGGRRRGGERCGTAEVSERKCQGGQGRSLLQTATWHGLAAALAPCVVASQFARVVKGVDLRSTGGNSAWVRAPQLTPCWAGVPQRMRGKGKNNTTNTNQSKTEAASGSGKRGAAKSRATRTRLRACPIEVRLGNAFAAAPQLWEQADAPLAQWLEQWYYEP